MWSWRKEAHKLANINKPTGILCNESVEYEGSKGIFITEVYLGSEVGTVTLNYDAEAQPDRFRIIYDGNLVADSLYVGNGLVNNPPSYPNFVGNTYSNIPEYFWDGSQYVLNGNTQNVVITQGDIAAYGESAGEGSLEFQKTSATPNTMTVITYAPLESTLWSFDTECPDGILES